MHVLEGFRGVTELPLLAPRAVLQGSTSTTIIRDPELGIKSTSSLQSPRLPAVPRTHEGCLLRCQVRHRVPPAGARLHQGWKEEEEEERGEAGRATGSRRGLEASGYTCGDTQGGVCTHLPPGPRNHPCRRLRLPSLLLVRNGFYFKY